MFNVMVVGKPRVGKSSLCQLYVKSQLLGSSPTENLQVFFVESHGVYLFDCTGQV